MAIAGKVAITPGYEWSVDVAYDKLVVVTFGNNVYLSTKPSTGIEPTNEEYWMLLIENVTAEDLAELQTTVENIINGTTPVGNAKDADTVDGKHASDFLPITGGTLAKAISAVLNINNTTADALYSLIAYYANSVNCGALGFYGANNPVFYPTDGSGKKALMHEGNYKNHVLPLDDSVPMSGAMRFAGGYGRVNAGHNWANLLSNEKKDGSLTDYRALQINNAAYVGAETVANALELRDMKDGVEKKYTVLHTGNKPTGSYTGNGDATARTIATGGIGFMCVIVSPTGGISFASSNGLYEITGSSVTSSADATFNNGVLTINSTKATINASGANYTYQVL